MSCEQFKSDNDYVKAIRQEGASGQYAADCLYRAYQARAQEYLQNYVGKWSGQHEDIRDLVQDAFLIMLKKIRFGGYNEGSLLHFWTGIAKGLLRNKVRRDSRTDLVEDNAVFEQVDLQSPESWMLAKEQHARVHSVLDMLGERCKKVLLLWAGGYSMVEIASEAGLSSEAMARKTKFKCKKKLVELVDQKGLEL